MIEDQSAAHPHHCHQPPKQRRWPQWMLAFGMSLTLVACAQDRQSTFQSPPLTQADARSFDAFINAGNASLAAGDPTGAAGLFRSAANIDPTQPLAQIKLGDSQLLAGFAQEAAESYRKAITLLPHRDPHQPFPPVASDAFRGLGNALVTLNQPDIALNYYQSAQDITPDDPRLYLGYGLARALVGQYDQAEALYQQGLTLRANDPDLISNLGLLLVAQGRTTEAIALMAPFATAVEASPIHRESLIIAYAVAGQIEQAEAVGSQQDNYAEIRATLGFYRSLAALKDPKKFIAALQTHLLQ